MDWILTLDVLKYGVAVKPSGFVNWILTLDVLKSDYDKPLIKTTVIEY